MNEWGGGDKAGNSVLWIFFKFMISSFIFSFLYFIPMVQTSKFQSAACSFRGHGCPTG